MKTKAIRRLPVLDRVSCSTTVLEARILSISTHGLLESVASFGLAITGAHASVAEIREIDTGVLTKAARRAVGEGPTVRKEIPRACGY